MTPRPDPNEQETWKLQVVAGPDTGRAFPVSPQRPLIIGRGTQSDTQIRDPRLSRVHCELRCEQGRFLLVDRGGSGGTLVEGRPIDSPRPLGNGGEFQIGDTRLRLHSDHPLDAATVRPRRAAEHQPPLPIRPMPELIGETLYRYRLDRLVANGRNSAIFKGFDTRRQRVVAVKVLKPQLASTEVQQQRFIRAMRATLPIVHPHIVRLFKAGRRGPYCWAALEWVDGISVAELIEHIGVRGMLDWKEAWRIAVHIGRALGEAERRQIVHRNITPSNILRRQTDQSYLLADLVLARALEQTDAPQLTRPGDVVGELTYLAPERILNPDSIDARSDQFSLGATLYMLLTGRTPFEALGVADWMERLRGDAPKPPTMSQLGVDDRFSDLVMRMISRQPEKRFPSAEVLLRELKRVGQLGGVDADWSAWS